MELLLWLTFPSLYILETAEAWRLCAELHTNAWEGQEGVGGSSGEGSVPLSTPCFSEQTVNIPTGDGLLQAGPACLMQVAGVLFRGPCSTKHFFPFQSYSFLLHIFNFLLSSMLFV